MNILYIHSHDTGRYIQPYGHAVDTPNLQRLAEEGVLFRQNFTINPTCSPSRACLLTGSYAHENGMLGLAHRGFRLDDYSQHIIHPLKKKGYRTLLSGVQHIANHDEGIPWQTIGYDECLGQPDKAHEKAAEFILGKPEGPFFLSVGFFETHREFPVEPDPRDDARYTLPPAPLPDTPETRTDMARFKTMARTLDRKMGVVFSALKTAGLYEDTLIICTTDHGIAFPRMKCHLHDSGTGVMLIMRGPGGFTGGKVIDAMTTHMDIYPTLCDLVGIEHPDWLRGKSLLPLVNQEVDALHDEIHAEVNFHAAYEPMRSVRTRRWKYIKRFDGRSTPVFPNCDDGYSKTLWLENGWNAHGVETEMLFDLLFDPNEQDNLCLRPQYGDVLADMRQRMLRWMETTDDPLLGSPVISAPAGARVNDSDGVSPRQEPNVVEG